MEVEIDRWGIQVWVNAGVPNLQAMDGSWSRPVRNQSAEQEVSLNVRCLNHPKPCLQSCSMEKLPSMKPVPGAKEVGDHWVNGSILQLP